MSSNVNGRQDAADPREFRFVRVGDLHIAADVQRALKAQQIANIRAAFDWNLLEVPTVAPDLTVIEGQQRVTAMQLDDEDRMILVSVIPSATTKALQAAIARGITKGRTPTKGFQDWKMRLVMGDPRVTSAAKILRDRSLWTDDPAVIKDGDVHLVPVSQVDYLSHFRSIEDSEALMGSVLDLLMGAWEEHHQQLRFTIRLMQAVGRLYRMNWGVAVSTDDLSSVLSRRTPRQWIEYGRASKPEGWSEAQTIGDYLAEEYNVCVDVPSQRMYWDDRS